MSCQPHDIVYSDIVYHYLTDDKTESLKDIQHQHDETKKMEDDF